MHKHSEKTLADRNIIVTGGSSGIGCAMAEALVHAQANVAIISRRSPEQWEHQLPASWQADHWIAGDFNQPELLIKNTEKWLAEHWSGEVDGIIHSAVSYGFGSRHTFLEIVPEELQEKVNVGVYGP
ncbi:MAG: SDR family NAD(P)-dependent oxidoreductase, partial [Ktedonobacteraceae bacterium]